MPREIVTRTTVYKYGELSDEAKAKAVEQVREKLSGPWWDSADDEDVEAVMLYSLAGALKSPGWDEFTEGDFPGIDRVQVVEWYLGRSQSLKLQGTLTRDNAPALPWVDGVAAVGVGDRDYVGGWRVDHEGETEVPEAAERELVEAIEGAIRKAWQAGYDEAECKTSDEYAEGWIEGNDPDFTEDGKLYG